ncbi:MAG: helix-turn-helix domain-containing protein [Bdellovibrionales bacterium]|nr:helix-turn-helix domain-containing protein [Bdellovibrionales bacterium]
MTFPEIYHLAARAERSSVPLTARSACHALWSSLRGGGHDVVAAVLMPNHLHVLAVGREKELHRWLACVIGAQARAGRGRWEAVPVPERIPDAAHLRRQIRYVHLNPCRARLAADPLEWEWSTHRDWLGLTHAPWVAVRRWAPLLGWHSREAGARLHRYVSADPSARVEGTPPPRAPVGGGDLGLTAVERAVRQYLRAGVDLGPAERRLAFAHARSRTAYRPAELARWLGVSRSTASRLEAGRASVPPASLGALDILAADPRFGAGGAPQNGTDRFKTPSNGAV